MYADLMGDVERVDYPVDLPLTVTYDVESGSLTLEAIVWQGHSVPVAVRLDLAADVASSFLEGLLAISETVEEIVPRIRVRRPLQ